MSRKTISEKELVDLLNREISKSPEVDNCRISGIYKLKKKPVESACNWSVVYFSSPTTPHDVAEAEIKKVVEKIQPLYNVH